jgi:hypothetical protein
MSANEADIGHGVTVSRTTDKAGEWVGLIRRHPKKGSAGERCASAVAFDTPASRLAHGESMSFHQVISLDPLTLSPSLLCRACGHHGHIVKGQWAGD